MKKRFVCGCLLLAAAVALAADPVSSYANGKSLQNREDWYGAIECYQEALRENPSYNLAYQGLAECFYSLGEYEEAQVQVLKAESFRKNDPALLDLHGFILIGLGKLDDAKSLFAQVLSSYPNDIRARFGLAEIDIASGRVSSARSQYLDALKRNPENRKALLSLALISKETGNDAAAREYVSKALQYHGDSPQVFYFAAYLASLDGRMGEAEGRIREALSLNPGYDDALELLAAILYRSGRYTEVLDICSRRISDDRNKIGAWYLKTLANERLGKYEEAVKAAQSGLQVAPNDELLRSLMESIVIERLPFEDTRRALWAAWHVTKARQFQENNLSEQALYEYRRALKVNPYDTSSRQAYARLLLARGYPERHVEQLRFVQSIGKSSNEVNDAVESYSKLLSTSVPNRWNIDPLYLEKAHTSIGLYFQTDQSNIMHPDAERITASMVAEVFGYDIRFSVASRETPVGSYSEAFRASRSKGEDYFGLVTFRENDRDMRINVDLYVSKTGSRADSFTVFRTGNDRYANALRRLVQTIASAMPVRGALVGRYQSDAVIDLGKSDGVVTGTVFSLFPASAVSVQNEGIGLAYDPAKLLGTFTVTEVDEDVSQGKLERNGFYDRINAGDIAIPAVKGDKEGPATESASAGNPPALLSQLRKIR